MFCSVLFLPFQVLEAADVELGVNYPKPIISIHEVGSDMNVFY